MFPESHNPIFAAIERIINKGEIKISAELNDSGIGSETLKSLCEAESKNMKSPGLTEWWIKLHMENPLIALINSVPEPPGIVRQMVIKFGGPHGKGRKSLKFTIKGKTKKDFQVVSDNNRFMIINKNNSPINPFWQRDVLIDAMKARFGRLIIVTGKVNEIDRTVNYTTATAYWNLNPFSLSTAILDGTFFISFKASVALAEPKHLSNPGIPFKIPVADLEKIYDSCKVIL